MTAQSPARVNYLRCLHPFRWQFGAAAHELDDDRPQQKDIGKNTSSTGDVVQQISDPALPAADNE